MICGVLHFDWNANDTFDIFTQDINKNGAIVDAP